MSTLSTNNISDLVEHAVVFADAAAETIRKRRAELGNVKLRESSQTKSSEVDPVTLVDLESEKLIRSLIAEYRPDDFILGEEGGLSRADGVRVAEGSIRRRLSDGDALEWVVDPIDGTVNFLYGLPVFAVSIAVRSNSETIAGAVADVPGHRVFFAGKGLGAKVRDATGEIKDIHASAPENLAQSLVATGFSYDAAMRSQQGAVVAKLLGKCRDIRRLGSAAMDLCLVAQGSIDAYYERGIKVWDYAAGCLIAQEAGAVIRELEPNSIYPSSSGAIAAARTVSDEFESILSDVGVLAD